MICTWSKISSFIRQGGALSTQRKLVHLSPTSFDISSVNKSEVKACFALLGCPQALCKFTMLQICKSRRTWAGSSVFVWKTWNFSTTCPVFWFHCCWHDKYPNREQFKEERVYLAFDFRLLSTVVGKSRYKLKAFQPQARTESIDAWILPWLLAFLLFHTSGLSLGNGVTPMG